MAFFKEKRSAINRRLLSYLVDHNVIQGNYYTQEQMCYMYLEHKKIEPPTDVEISDFIVQIFSSGQLYPEFKRKKRRPKGTTSYTEYLKSKAWYVKRDQIKSLKNNKCEKCGSIRNLQVHHKTYKRLGNELLTDLQLLCDLCHKEIHRNRIERKNGVFRNV